MKNTRMALAPYLNPARGGRFSVSLALPSASPTTLELLDLAGRRLSKLEVGSLGAGTHAVSLAERLRLAHGLYLVRITQGPVSKVARAVVVGD